MMLSTHKPNNPGGINRLAVRDLSFTCGLGVFTFDSNVKLSHAKLLRDTVIGQYYNPKTGSKRLKDERDIHDYVDSLPELLSGISFGVEIRRDSKTR